MSSKKIQDLPLKKPLPAMKIPTGGFGDYAITAKTLVEWFKEAYDIVDKKDLENLQGVIERELNKKAEKKDIYTKDEVDDLIAQQLILTDIPVFSDNKLAKSNGLVTGDHYRTSTGILMIVY